MWDGFVFKLVTESRVRPIVMEQLATVYARLHEDIEKELARTIDKEDYLRLQRKQKSLRNYNYSKDVESTMKVLTGEMHVDGFARELNRDPHIINTLNGVVDLRTGALDIHRPQYLCTEIIPTAYKVRGFLLGFFFSSAPQKQQHETFCQQLMEVVFFKA